MDTNKLTIAVASGKGGTGKTTFAVNLAKTINREVVFLDADVEEPNGHIFLKPDLSNKEKVLAMLPQWQKELCIDCRLCSKVCAFNSIVNLKGEILVFPELCHGCGACIIKCPVGALKEDFREIGQINLGNSNEILFGEGRLQEGEAKSPPLIKQLVKQTLKEKIKIIDASPGTSCPTIEAVRRSDYVVLVTEPTPFGLHDLKLAVEMVKTIKLPFGVVLNKYNLGDKEVQKYCTDENIPIIMEIPFNKQYSLSISKGELLVDIYPELKKSFLLCLDKVKTGVKQ